MNYKFEFKNGEAILRLEATLPLPVAPLAIPPDYVETLPHPALEQIEELLPVALSELVFGRNQHESQQELV